MRDPFHFQFAPFMSEDNGAAEGGAAAAEANKEADSTITPEELARQIEEAKEAGRAEAKTAYEQELAKKLEESKTEAEKLAKMTADEKTAYEREQREASLAKREADIARRELESETVKVLADKGLPAEVRDLVIGKDAADTVARIDTFKATFNKAVQAAVEARLQGKTPMASSAKQTSPDEEARASFSAALKGGNR